MDVEVDIKNLEEWKQTVDGLVCRIESLLWSCRRDPQFEIDFCAVSLDQLTLSAMYTIEQHRGNSAPFTDVERLVRAVYRHSITDDLQHAPGFDDAIRPTCDRAMTICEAVRVRLAAEHERSVTVNKQRPKQAEMKQRNKAVAFAAGQMQVKYGRLPTVDEIMRECKLTQQQVYATNSYKDGKIVKRTAKLTAASTGGSVTSSEYFSSGSVEGSRSRRQTRSDQDELDATIDQQGNDNWESREQRSRVVACGGCGRDTTSPSGFCAGCE